MSWSMPSVTKIAPPTLSGGVSLERLLQRAEQLGALVVGVVARASRRMRASTLSSAASCFSISARAASVCALALAEPIAGRAVDDHRDDVLQRPAVLALQAGSASASSNSAAASARSKRARAGARQAVSATTTSRARPPSATIQAQSGSSGREPQRPRVQCASLSSRSLRVDLIGLVVAGERVHHQIDAAAQRHLALARTAGSQRMQRLAASSRRPGAGEVVRGDDDRRHAVAGARRAC